MRSLWDNLLVRFSVISLVVLATVAVSISLFVSDRMKSDAIDQVIDHAAFDTHVMALGALEPADFEGLMAGERLNEFDRWLRATLLTDVTAMVKVWSVDGPLIYSSYPSDIEEDPMHEPHLPTALRGEVAAHMHLADKSSPGNARGNDLIEVYAPVVFPGNPEVLGATEIYQYYAPTAQRINEMKAWVFLITGIGFVILYGALVAVVWGASRTISRQRSALVEANVELESRVEARTEENTRLYREREAAAAEKAVVDEVASIVTSTLDIDQVYEKFAAEMRKLVDFDRVTITLVDHDAGTFTPKYVAGAHLAGREVDIVVPLEGTMTERLLRTGQPVLRADLQAYGRYAGDSDRLQAGMRSELMVPLFGKGRITGGLALLSSHVAAYGPREQAVLERLADQIAPAVENAQLYELLRRSEATNRAFVEAIPDAMFRLTGDGTLLDFTARKGFLGLPAKFLGGNLSEVVSPELNEDAMDAISRALQTGETQIHQYNLTVRGEVRNCEARVVASGLNEVVIIARDETERRRAEEALRRLAEETTTITEIGRIINTTLDIDQVYEEFAAEVKKLVDFDRAAINVLEPDAGFFNVSYLSGVHYDEQEGTRRVALEGTITERVLRTGLPLLRGDIAAGDAFPHDSERLQSGLRSSLSVPLFNKGSVTGTLMVYSRRVGAYGPREQGILERLADQIAPAVENARLYESLLQSEATNRAFVRAIPDIMYRVRRDGTILDYTREKREFLLDPSRELAGRTVNEVLPPEVAQPYTQSIEGALRTGEIQTIEYQLTIRGEARDREARFVANGPDEALITVRDVTERRRLEGQLLQAQKMEVVGQLAGGVAHDFNNLLTPILGFSALGMNELSPDHPAGGYFEEVQGAAERGADLVRRLLTFARRQDTNPRAVNPNDVVLNTERMLHRLIGENIELVCPPAPELGTVKIDPGQVEQVLVNMAINARDAMPRGGRLTIETANVILDTDSAAEFPGLAPGRYVTLSISDTGTGMDEEVRSHLFEPFFTTKEVGKGTGLGLAVCYGIVKQSGGDIGVRSEPGLGTTFDIYLPRTDAVATSVAEGRAPVEMPTGTETVLLVEDEPSVRGLATLVLRRQGYTVLDAANGAEALRVARDHPGDEIGLLLTDVVMPHMSGKELAGHLQPLMPGLKVLMTSGFPDEAAVPGQGWNPGISFIPKPFTPAELARRVREVLDTPGPGS